MCAWSRDERERRAATSEGQQGAVGDRSERWSRRLYEIPSVSPRMCGGSCVRFTGAMQSPWISSRIRNVVEYRLNS